MNNLITFNSLIYLALVIFCCFFVAISVKYELKLRHDKIKLTFLIDKIYILAAIIVVFLSLINYYKFNFTFDCIKFLVLIAVASIIMVVDFYTHTIPNKFVLVGVVSAFIFALISSLINSTFIYLIDFFIGLFVSSLPLLAVVLITKGKMGAGDFKFLAMVGCFLGMSETLLALFYSIEIAGIVSIVLLIFRIMTMKSKVPFAPFIAFGTFVALFTDVGLFPFSMFS